MNNCFFMHKLLFVAMKIWLWYYLLLFSVHSTFAGSTPTLVVFDAEWLQEAFLKHFNVLTDRNTPKFGSNLDNGLLSIKGDHWKFVRQLLSPVLTSGKLKQIWIGLFWHNYINGLKSSWLYNCHCCTYVLLKPLIWFPKLKFMLTHVSAKLVLTLQLNGTKCLFFTVEETDWVKKLWCFNLDQQSHVARRAGDKRSNSLYFFVDCRCYP